MLLSELLIKRKDGIDAKLTHHLEAGTIDQAQLPAVGRQQGRDAKRMDRCVDPIDLKIRHNGLLHGTNDMKPKAPLHKRERLE